MADETPHQYPEMREHLFRPSSGGDEVLLRGVSIANEERSGSAHTMRKFNPLRPS